ERALAQEIDGLGTDEDRLAVEALHPTMGDPGESPGRSEGGPADYAYEGSSMAEETVVAGDQLGALPLKVTSLGGGARTADLAVLLGILPKPRDTEDLAAVLAGAEDQAAAELLTVSWAALQPSTTPEHHQVPDYLFAVCALVLGLGLSSG